MKILFDFFKRLESERWSGEVEVTSSQGHATILLKDGQFLNAYRPLDRAFERVEKMEWMKPPLRERIPLNASWEVFARELLQSNSEQYGRVVQYLKMERLELFFRIFFWTNVELTPRAYDVKTPDPVALGFYTLKRIESLLKEAKRRTEEWPKIQDKVGSSKRIFVNTVQLPSSLMGNLDLVDRTIIEFGSKTQSGTQLPQLPYTAEQIEILKLCDGRNTVQDLVRLSAEGEFLTLRRLVDLWRKGAVRPKDGDQTDTRFKVRFRALSLQELSSAAAAIFLISVLSLFISWLNVVLFKSVDNRPSTSAIETTEVLQAISLYRRLNSSYPLSLVDLSLSTVAPPQKMDQYSYSLKDPSVFDLKIKPRR